MFSWSICRCWRLRNIEAEGGARIGGGGMGEGIELLRELRALIIFVSNIWLCRSISRRRSFVNDMFMRLVRGTDIELKFRSG